MPNPFSKVSRWAKKEVGKITVSEKEVDLALEIGAAVLAEATGVPGPDKKKIAVEIVKAVGPKYARNAASWFRRQMIDWLTNEGILKMHQPQP